MYQIPAALEPIPVHRLSNFTKKYFDGGEGYHRGFSQCILQTVDNTLDDSTGQAAEILWTAENNFARSANIQRNMDARMHDGAIALEIVAVVAIQVEEW